MTEPSLRILALSDLHGRFFKEASSLIDATRPDWIVLCGDILPDFGMIAGKESRLIAQRDFWRTYRKHFIRDFAVTTMVRGNHEIEGFLDRELLRIPARLQGSVVRLEGIPVEFGGWGWSREWEEADLVAELQTQLAQNPTPRIYISHVPPFGCLDRTAGAEHIGHRALFQHLHDRNGPQGLVLCGHVHESFSHKECGDSMVVNAACGYALVDWRPEGFKLLKQERLSNDRPEDWEF